MVRVNNKEIKTYQLDTRQSIITRISATLGTVPKYLYFPDGLPEDPTTVDNIRVEDILQEIKNDAKESTTFSTFLKRVREKIPNNMDIVKNILYPWLAYNTQLEKLSKMGSMILKQEADNFVDDGYFDDADDFVRFWKNLRKGVIYDIEKSIQNVQRDDKSTRKLYKTFQKIDDDDALVHTDFTTDRVSIQFNLDLHDITLLEIFNHVILNETVPFVSVKNYFKILKDFIPPEEWATSEQDYLVVKVNSRQKTSDTKVKDYVDVKVSVQGEIGDEKVIASTKINTKSGYLSRDDFIQRFISIFQGLGEIKYTNVLEKEVNGNFFFPQERINTYVFSDMVMNNPLFSSLINIDESNKATKKDTASGQPWLHIIFNHPSTGRVSASFTQKQVDRADKTIRETDPELLIHGEPYISVRILRGRDRQSIEIFQLMLSKLLVIYNQEYNSIVEIYEQYIPEFGIVEEYEVPERKSKLELIAPDIFVKKYSRNCAPSERMPTLLTSEKKANKYKKKGKQIMVFPRPKQEQEPHYPSDGTRQYYYVCTNPEYPYPGLQKNKLGNADDYPYVPCCFKYEQKDKVGGNYRKYFFNEITEQTDKRQQGLISTNKILNIEQYGNIPEKLDRLFSMLETESNYRFIRVGVNRTKSSFLHSVMIALHEQTGILELKDEDEQEAYILSTREKMANSDVSVVARQCCYDMTLKQIKKELNDPEVYLNPKKYIQVLESYFNCNIYLFNSEQMFLPDYSQSYYKYKKSSPCVFIYEHMGSESDHAKYPQCELIVRWNVKRSDDTEYSLPSNHTVSKSINSIFKIMRESYALNNKIFETEIDWSDIQMNQQVIDSYGKTRRIDIVYKDKDVTILTDPIPPLAIPEAKNKSNVHVIKGKRALEMLKTFGAKVVSQTIDKETVKEINAVMGNVNISIPVIEQLPFDSIPISDNGLHYPEETESYMDLYNNNKKLARYITEYSFWLFSQYLNAKGKDIINDKLLANFAKKNIQIIPNFQYKKVKKIFSMKGGVMKDNKLVVTSEDMLKRLMYVLKLYSIRNLPSLIEYRKHNVITHFYVDITDFTYNPRQVILHGDESVDIWIQENRFSHVLHDKIVIGQRIPYFFKNNLVENKVFLAQNTETLDKAIAISLNWQRNGYNPGTYISGKSKKYNFTLYSYVNENDITTREITDGKNPKSTIRILGYKLSNQPYYTVLLELD